MNSDQKMKINELNSQLNKLGKEPQSKLKESTRNKAAREKQQIT